MKKILASLTILILVASLSFLPLSAQSFGTQAAAISFSSTGANTVIAATAGKAIRVSWIWFCVSAATNLTIVEVRPSTNSGAIPMGANGCATLPGTPTNTVPLVITSVGNAFILSQSGTAQVSGAVYYDLTNI